MIPPGRGSWSEGGRPSVGGAGPLVLTPAPHPRELELGDRLSELVGSTTRDHRGPGPGGCVVLSNAAGGTRTWGSTRGAFRSIREEIDWIEAEIRSYWGSGVFPFGLRCERCGLSGPAPPRGGVFFEEDGRGFWICKAWEPCSSRAGVLRRCPVCGELVSRPQLDEHGRCRDSRACAGRVQREPDGGGRGGAPARYSRSGEEYQSRSPIPRRWSSTSTSSGLRANGQRGSPRVRQPPEEDDERYQTPVGDGTREGGPTRAPRFKVPGMAALRVEQELRGDLLVAGDSTFETWVREGWGVADRSWDPNDACLSSYWLESGVWVSVECWPGGHFESKGRDPECRVREVLRGYDESRHLQWVVTPLRDGVYLDGISSQATRRRKSAQWYLQTAEELGRAGLLRLEDSDQTTAFHLPPLSVLPAEDWCQRGNSEERDAAHLTAQGVERYRRRYVNPETRSRALTVWVLDGFNFQPAPKQGRTYKSYVALRFDLLRSRTVGEALHVLDEAIECRGRPYTNPNHWFVDDE